MHRRQSSQGKDDSEDQPDVVQQPSTSRHQRIHSRNLSVHFPRPSSASHPNHARIPEAQDEEKVQEIEIKEFQKPFGAGFKFGAKLPSQGPPSPPNSAKARRGHHHKHSLSHNFFSFLEPGSNQPSPIITSSTPGLSPSPSPIPPWTPLSATPQHPINVIPPKTSFWAPLIATIAQFLVGAILWVKGQQAPSLTTTALGYWIVFDALGLAISSGLALRFMGVKSQSTHSKPNLRRPFGNGRVETLFFFSLSVYLMFSAVYVCKETVEHLLLSAGGGVSSGDRHHHHRGDEEVESGGGIQFPVFLILSSLLSLFWTSLHFDNHSRLLSFTNIRLPFLFAKFLPSFAKSAYLQSGSSNHSPLEQVILSVTNPYTVLPVSIGLSLLFVCFGLPSTSQHTADLFLSAAVTCLTFNLAYRPCVVLGAVLLQTSPPRSKPSSRSRGNSSPSSSLADGKMENFLRIMREVERHPHVLHLPAPHIWQLEPISVDSTSNISSSELVVTIDLHVRAELPDSDALELTRWVWEKCVSALGSPGAIHLSRTEIEPEAMGVQVNVGIVRG